jgi:hypothetical protein
VTSTWIGWMPGDKGEEFITRHIKLYLSFF